MEIRILANSIFIRALAGTDLLPLNRQSLEMFLGAKMNQGKLRANLQAFQAGLDLMNKVHGSGFTICRRRN
ncbi:MAG: hypothetical protein K9K64_03620 [Desulfohalobiaceae bacterium]|nr:hypothetical protein [Desulfohalobiaceae bacterium]